MLSKLETFIDTLCRQEQLPRNAKVHPLRGKWKDCWECHIAPGWLLIWRIEDGALQLIRTGSHAELFE